MTTTISQLDPADLPSLTAAYQELIDRPIASPADLDRWLTDFSDLTATVDELGTRRYIAKTCNTADPDIEKAFLDFVQRIEPAIKPPYFELQKKYLASPHRAALLASKDGHRHQMLTRKWQADVELFRPENIPLSVQITEIVNDYDKINGSLSVVHNGKEYTLQQASRFLEDPDRTTRETVWKLIAHRRLQERAKVDDLFSSIIPLRHKLAQNAGKSDFRAFTWTELKRFDYTPEDCINFASSIEQSVMPLIVKLDEHRRQKLGVDKLRPWDRTTTTSDVAVDITGDQPLRPFSSDDIPTLIHKTTQVFDRVSPLLAADFDSLRANNNLDLASRKAKAPGGYQSSLEKVKQPFIFMNAAGLQRDLETLLHEGGHAFHYIAAAKTEPLVFLRSAPIEFCEVASMGMELLAQDHLDVFYTPEDSRRAGLAHFESILRFFPWMAMIDQFQHWLYTHPTHTADQRTAAWRKLIQRFGGACDWTGLEDARDALWQRQLHLFHVPFYYVEYGIAQLGALQLWLMARQDPRRAVERYRAALALGGTRPLPDLFAAAGIHFDFSQKTLAPLMQAVAEELQL
jgi:oligoendopeptidase F